MASMVVAGVVEGVRCDVFNNKPHIIQKIGSKNFTAADWSIYYQIPQYALIGISEVFASVGGESPITPIRPT